MTLGPGYRLGNYTVVRSLGSGGMADVYEAHDETLERTVALKVLPLEYTRNPQLVARFQKEVRAAAKLNHRGIVTVFEVGHHGSHHYFSMRLLTGGDLRKRIEARLSSVEALAILRELADAFAHAHARGFIHRDVKPENVMFDEQGFPVLTDFGIAKALDANTHMTRTGMTMGTPRYLSPEQASGKPVDARSDLYSLGVMLHEMLTGRPPYDAEEPMAVIFKHVTEPIPQLPAEFGRFQPLLEKLMAKEPNQRFGSAADLIRAIDALAPAGAPAPQSQLRTAENPLLAGLLTPSPLRTPAPQTTPRQATRAPAPAPRPESGEVAVAPPVLTRQTAQPRPAPALAPAPAPAPVREITLAAVAAAPAAVPVAPGHRVPIGLIGMIAGLVVAAVTGAWAIRSFVLVPGPIAPPVAAPVIVPDAATTQAEEAERLRLDQARQEAAVRKQREDAAVLKQREAAAAQKQRDELAALARQRAEQEAAQRKAADIEARRKADAEARRRAEADATAKREQEQAAARAAEEERQAAAAAAARKKLADEKATTQQSAEERERLEEEKAKERARRPTGF